MNSAVIENALSIQLKKIININKNQYDKFNLFLNLSPNSEILYKILINRIFHLIQAFCVYKIISLQPHSIIQKSGLCF